MFEIKYIEDEPALSKVLHLCYSVLGESTAQNELYSYDAWKKRMGEFSRLLVYAQENDRVISLVLGRPENNDSLVCGCVACHPDFRRQGITRRLMQQFETNAKAMNFRYITLGAADESVGFYEKCGYKEIMEIHGQKIYQKML